MQAGALLWLFASLGAAYTMTPYSDTGCKGTAGTPGTASNSVGFNLCLDTTGMKSVKYAGVTARGARCVGANEKSCKALTASSGCVADDAGGSGCLDLEHPDGNYFAKTGCSGGSGGSECDTGIIEKRFFGYRL